MDAPEPTPAEAAQAAYAAVGINTETGVAFDGDYPANARLRAEALAADGKASDPTGIVSDELIAATADRVASEKAEAEANTPSLKWTRDDLAAEAARLGVTHETDANKAAILAAITAAPAAPTQEG